LTKLLSRPWLTPVLYELKKSGRCSRQITLPAMRRTALKSLVWSLTGIGLAVRSEEGLCLTDEGLEEARKVELVAERGSVRLYRYGERIYVLVRFKPTRITAYTVPYALVERAKSVQADDHRVLAEKLNVHPKTASIVLRVLKLLGQEPNTYNP
jgi:hypothetical protein